MALTCAMPQESGVRLISYLALLFATSMGEAYFPDVMNINTLQAKANWLFLANALGNACVVVVRTEKSWKDIPILKAALPAACDMLSQVFLLGGIALSSAQTKSILYNSCIVWSAVLSKCFLGKILSCGQWGGVFVLISGLLIKADFSKSGDGEGTLLLGMCFILIGCALHSLTNVVNEYYIRSFGFPPPKLCTLIGFFSVCTWLLLFVCGFIIPETKDGEWIWSNRYFVVSEMSKQSADTPLVNWVAWVGFVVSSAGHALAYFTLLESIGNVSCGVMKGLTTAGYVTLSILLLCDADKRSKAKYCFTWKTFFAASICVAGVFVYTYFTKVENDRKIAEISGLGDRQMSSQISRAESSALHPYLVDQLDHLDASTFGHSPSTELRATTEESGQPQEGNAA